MGKKYAGGRSEAKSSDIGVLFICLTLALVTGAIYWQTQTFDFVNYDDNNYVTDNPHVKAGLTANSIAWAFTSSHASNWHPLTWLSHMLDCELFGLNPGRHHFVNLLLHVANTLVLFLLLRYMTGTLWPSAFVAAAFALHPLHVESVAWVSERKDVLSTFFWLLTMAGYVRYVKSSRWIWYALTVVSFTVGLMAKPMLVTFPFVLLLLDYWPLNRFDIKPKARHRPSRRHILFGLVLEKIPFFVLAAASSAVTIFAQKSGGAMAKLEWLPISVRMSNAAVSYVTYIQKLIWPSRLAIFYPYPRGGIAPGKIIATVVLLIAITVLLARLGRKQRPLRVGWLWFLGTLVPVIGLVQVGNQAWADRYSYISFIGLFIVIAWAVPEFLSKLRYRTHILATASIAILCVWSVCSYAQLGYWRNSTTLFERALSVTEGNYKTHYNLGFTLQTQGKFEEAAAQYKQTLQMNPTYTEAHSNLGIVYQRIGKLDDAIACYNEALELKPDYYQAHNNLGAALHHKGRIDEAISHYRAALRTKPDYAEAYNNLGFSLQSQAKTDEAMECFNKALELEPENGDALNNLGSAFYARGKLEQAEQYYRRAIKTNPDFTKAHYNLGRVLSDQGRKAKAIRHYRLVLERQPDLAEAHYHLANILQSNGQVDEAVTHYRQALRAAPEYAQAHNNLGITLALKGKINEAVKHFRQAVRTQPDYAEANCNLGTALKMQGKLDEAVKYFGKAIKEKQDYPEALNEMARILVTHPDPNQQDAVRAVTLAKRASELTDNRNPAVLETLAVAYAAAGRFELAADTAQKALTLVPKAKNEPFTNRISKLLAHYRIKAGR